MQHITTGKPYEAAKNYSPGIVAAGKFLFTSGLTGRGPDGRMVSPDLGEQTRQVVANLKDIFRAAGTDCTRIVKLNIYVLDIDSYLSMHHLIDELMVNNPASTLVQVPRLAQPDMQIEIETVVLL